MSKAVARLFTQTCCWFIKSELGTRFPRIFALKRSALGGCNCPCWSHWEALPVTAPGAEDTDAALPSSGDPGTSARTCHYLRLPCHHRASPFSPCVLGRDLCQFSWHLPKAAHLAFKLLRNVLWLFSLFNEPTWGTWSFLSSRLFPRHSHLHHLCGDSETPLCCCTNPSAKNLITKSAGLPKEIFALVI